MSGIVGSRLNIRGSGLVGNIGTDGQVLTSSGAGQELVFEDAGGGAVTAINNATANELVSIGSTTTELDAESTLTFDGSALVVGGTTPSITIGDAGEEDTKLVYDGNAIDFYIGLDDSEDKLVIGDGSTVGTNNIMTFANDRVTLGDGAANDLAIIFDGNEYDFYIALDDSKNNLTIGAGNSVGTTNCIDIEEDGTAVWIAPPIYCTGGAVFNENSANVDFRIESDTGQATLTHAFFLDASTSNIGIGQDTPIAEYASGGPICIHMGNGSNQWASLRLEDDGGSNEVVSDGDLRFFSDGIIKMLISIAYSRVGVMTVSPGQVLDVNSGSGNMIADGYDTHSLARYKENIENASGYLDKVIACPVRKWNKKPFVSADEIKIAAIEQFGQAAWDVYFDPNKPHDSHRAKALYNMPEGEMKTWIDEWCEARRAEQRPEEKWQKKKLGLVADEEITATHLPEVISKNEDGAVSGIDTMSYIGILHNAIQELETRVRALGG